MKGTNINASGCISGVLLCPTADGTVTKTIGELSWQDGRFTTIEPSAQAAARIIIPGFVDLHTHWPQGHVRGTFDGQLLPWLRDFIWPAETAFRDLKLAQTRGQQFAMDLLRAGTTTALTFGPPYVATCLQTALNLFAYDGPALMEVNAPADMCASAIDTLAMIETWSNHSPDHRLSQIVVSPRFAPSMSVEGLRACGEFAEKHGLLVQSHLSENLDEIAWVAELFPEATDYTDVYDRAGLLGPRTVMAHGIHLSDRELTRLAETATTIAHCPSSNEALQSGRAPIERYREHGVAWVLATDVGAGPNVSQLDAMAAFLRQHEAAGVPVTASEALARATLFPGRFLADHDDSRGGLGTLDEGACADLIALQLPAGCSPGDDAETLLRGLLEADRATFETLPSYVVRSGITEIAPASVIDVTR